MVLMFNYNNHKEMPKKNSTKTFLQDSCIKNKNDLSKNQIKLAKNTIEMHDIEDFLDYELEKEFCKLEQTEIKNPISITNILVEKKIVNNYTAELKLKKCNERAWEFLKSREILKPDLHATAVNQNTYNNTNDNNDSIADYAYINENMYVYQNPNIDVINSTFFTNTMFTLKSNYQINNNINNFVNPQNFPNLNPFEYHQYNNDYESNFGVVNEFYNEQTDNKDPVVKRKVGRPRKGSEVLKGMKRPIRKKLKTRTNSVMKILNRQNSE